MFVLGELWILNHASLWWNENTVKFSKLGMKPDYKSITISDLLVAQSSFGEISLIQGVEDI